jgi:hypothetical protein
MPADRNESNGVVVDLTTITSDKASDSDDSRDAVREAEREKRMLWRRRKAALRGRPAIAVGDVVTSGE